RQATGGSRLIRAAVARRTCKAVARGWFGTNTADLFVTALGQACLFSANFVPAPFAGCVLPKCKNASGTVQERHRKIKDVFTIASRQNSKLRVLPCARSGGRPRKSTPWAPLPENTALPPRAAIRQVLRSKRGNEEPVMAYDLEDFIADCRATLARDPGPRGREHVRVDLETLLADPP